MDEVERSLFRNSQLLWNVSQEIWKHPELCFQEKFAHDLLTSSLENSGFSVQRHYFLPTAFRAEFDSGRDGPTIAAVCEYDALPAIGHACGHNLIAEIGLGVGLAVKDALRTDVSAKGKIVVLGTPAEEGGGGKILLIENGAFADIDAAVMAHPQAANLLYPFLIASVKVDVKFESSCSNPWEGANAVDAAVSCYNNISLIRKCLKEKWRLSAIIPSTSCQESTMKLILRAPLNKEVEILFQRLETCVAAAAHTSTCSFKITKDPLVYKEILCNQVISGVFQKYALEKGIAFRDEDPDIAPRTVSSDMGNVSHVVPSIQPEFEIGAHPHFNHTQGFAECAGSEGAQKNTLLVAEALAKTVVELMSDDGCMRRVKEEFEKSTSLKEASSSW